MSRDPSSQQVPLGIIPVNHPFSDNQVVVGVVVDNPVVGTVVNLVGNGQRLIGNIQPRGRRDGDHYMGAIGNSGFPIA